jgi:hypothetical protein
MVVKPLASSDIGSVSRFYSPIPNLQFNGIDICCSLLSLFVRWSISLDKLDKNSFADTLNDLKWFLS